MAGASFQVSSFYGGEWSKSSQGRADTPEYRTALNVCLNWIVTEGGSLTRRPGTVNGSETRGGARGRVIKFDFQASAAYTCEYTDGYVRFRQGARLATTNDGVSVVAISTANPAVVKTAAVVSWTSGNTVYLTGTGVPIQLQNRRFVITIIDNKDFSLQDAVTLATIDGSTLSALGVGVVVNRVQELTTPYTSGAWSSLRSIQAETNAILLQGSTAPQILQTTSLPTATADGVFSLGNLTFVDGPYLDPFTNGVQAVPGGLSGIISLTLQFPAWSATQAYKLGDFVTASGNNYRSLIDANINNTPASSPTAWAPTQAAAAIGTNGFQGSDVGRLVRLYSQPAAWVATTPYVAGNIVSYNGLEWTAIATTTGNIPGNDLVNWTLTPGNAAVWTWGRITSLLNQIGQNPAGSSNIGDMTGFGGLSSAFDGVTNKLSTASAVGQAPAPFQTSLINYIGKDYGASPQAVAEAIVYPTQNLGFFFAGEGVGHITSTVPATIYLSLRGSQTAPSGAGDGTLLYESPVYGVPSSPIPAGPITLISADQVTQWRYVWVQFVVQLSQAYDPGVNTTLLENFTSQVFFFNPPSTTTGTGVNMEILGPPLLYTAPIVTWRIGVFSNSTGWPTCGAYHEGRIWLGGAVANRFDASVTNGISGSTINFAPTDRNGVVSDSNAISGVLNSDGVNTFSWMQPDLQGIICGTLAGEYLIQAPTTGPITPTNIAVRRVTKIGCANIEPRRTDHTNVFVRRYRRKIMEYFSDVFSGKFSAPNLSQKAEHIVAPFVSELAYCDAVDPIIWGRCDDGSFFGLSYKRDTLATSQGPTFSAFHRQSLGSGRVVESICSGPSTDGTIDTLTMVTNDTATNVRMVELLTDAFNETSSLQEAWLLDNSCNPTSVSSSTVAAGANAPYGGMTMNGLSYLNGKTVSVFAGGLDCGDFTVSGGSIFVPYGDGVSGGSGSGLFTAAFATALPLTEIVIGFTYTSDVQLVRPATPQDSGARNGPAFGKTRRSARYAIQTVNAAGLWVGTDFGNMLPIQFKDNGGRALAALNTFSGVYRDDLQDNYSYDSMLAVRVTRPLPAIIVAMGAYPHTQDI